MVEKQRKGESQIERKDGREEGILQSIKGMRATAGDGNGRDVGGER